MPMDGRGEAVRGVVAMSGGFGFSAGSMIPLNMRGTPWRDQVPRQQAFEQAHSEVVITPPGGPRIRWEAVIPDRDPVKRFHLSDLLDALEALLGPP